jgi:hypothetical protein
MYTTPTHPLLKQQIREGSFYMYSLKFNLLNISSDIVSDSPLIYWWHNLPGN